MSDPKPTPSTFSSAGAGLTAVEVADGPTNLVDLRAGIAARAAPLPPDSPPPPAEPSKTLNESMKAAVTSLSAMDAAMQGYEIIGGDRIEVELKFPLPTRVDVTGNVIEDIEAFRDSVKAMGGKMAGRCTEEDTYYNIPSQPPDTYVRIRLETPVAPPRQVKQGADMTWKGPKLSRDSKSRPEETVEIGHDPHNLTNAARFLTGLGYSEFVRVKKTRESYALQFESVQVSVMIDRVEDAGIYAELEIISIREAAVGMAALLRVLAAKLGLGTQEQRGYAELVTLKRQEKVQGKV